MTENNNAQTMSLEDITRALTELAKHVEAIRGGENAPELDPNDPLNEIVGDDRVATDSSAVTDVRVRTLLEDSGEPRTIRNLLKTYMKTIDPDNWYTLRSTSTRKYYRIIRVYNQYVTTPDGSSQVWTSGHDISLPVPIEELTAGWRVGNSYKVLDVFELNSKKYIIAEIDNS
jgi:hypothetical protein|nr:MAG TPA: hypothetical protein [Caudoviricetes sp.]